MENIETKYKYKQLYISVLKELWSYTPWKNIHKGMERPKGRRNLQRIICFSSYFRKWEKPRKK
jgi:hypothetical protein